MAQLVTRIADEAVDQIDALIAEGVVESRSDAVRQGLLMLLDRHRRRLVACAITAGYVAHPQVAREVGWSDAATVRMIADEPW